MTVTEVIAGIARHPVRFLGRWNWKAALVSAAMRGAVFFGATLDSGVESAARTLMVDAAFRVPMAGVCAAVIQELRWAEPGWAAAAIAAVAVPAAAHSIEIIVHSWAGTPLMRRAVVLSIGVSAASSAIELLLMRRDIMLVGPESGSLLDDLRRVVRLTRRGS